MKIRNGFVSNSSSSSFTTMRVKEADNLYCPYCFSNRELYQIEDDPKYYECRECKTHFDNPLTLKDLRKLKLEEICN